MTERRCPKCGAKAAPLDTHCMDCGADLTESAGLERRLDDAMRVKQSITAAVAPPTSGSAAHGTAALGERSKDTRLRVFDRQEADKLKAERVTAFATAGIAFIACMAFGVLAMSRFREAGGLDGIKELSMRTLRDWSVFANAGVAAIWYAAGGIGSLLCVAGQVVRGLKAGKAIALVEANEKPEIVGISAATQIGMMLFAAICPPFGIIVGIIMKLSKDENTNALGGMVLVFGFGALVILAGNWVWGVAAAAAAKHRPQPKVEEEALLWWQAVMPFSLLADRLRLVLRRRRN